MANSGQFSLRGLPLKHIEDIFFYLNVGPPMPVLNAFRN